MPKYAIVPYTYLINKLGYFLMRDVNQKFDLIKLFSIFEKIYIDKEELYKVINGFSKDNDKKKEYILIVEELFKFGLFIDLPLGDLITKNVGKFPQNIDRGEIYHFIYLKEAINKKCCLIDSEPFDTLNEFIIKYFPESAGYFKMCHKYKDIGYYVIDYFLPNFYLKDKDIKEFIKLVENSNNLNKKISEIYGLLGGYKILDGEKVKIVALIEKDKQLLLKNQKIIIESGGTELGLDIIGIFSGLPVPLGFAKYLIASLIKDSRIKKNKLEWIIYLIALSHFQNTKKNKKESCTLCNIPLSELKNKTEEECQKMLGSKLCIAHMVVWLNLKEFRKSAKQFLILIKENEDRKDVNLNTSLGKFD